MKKELNGVDVLSFVIHGAVGVRLLTLPRDIIEHANNNGWISVLVSGLTAFFLGFAFYWLCIKHPGLNISQIVETTLGKFLGKIIMVGISVYIILSIGLALRSTAMSIKVFLLDTTPLIVVVIIMIIPTVYAVSKGVKTMSIVLDILLPIVLFSIIMLAGLSYKKIEFQNLRPVFYGGVTPVIRGSLDLVHPYLGIGIIGYIFPSINNPKSAKKWISVGIIITLVIYLLVVTLTILVFGTEEAKILVWPTVSLSKAIQLETELFERLESLFMAVWIPVAFTTVLTFYYSSILNLKALFNTNRDHLIIYGQVPLITIIALLPDNIVELYKYLDWVNIMAMFLTFVVIPTMIFMTLIDKRRMTQ